MMTVTAKLIVARRPDALLSSSVAPTLIPPLPNRPYWYNSYTVIDFQYDPKKSQSNLRKHGIDFEEAQMMWNDPDLLEIGARSDDEPRSLFIGRLRRKIWSAVVTFRGAEVRIISVRRARAAEIERYES